MEYQFDFTEEELYQIFGQSYQAMILDARQHMLLTTEQQEADKTKFLSRQNPRFSILVKVLKAFKDALPDNLLSLYKEAEEIMLFARGLDDARCGSSDTKTT